MTTLTTLYAITYVKASFLCIVFFLLLSQWAIVLLRELNVLTDPNVPTRDKWPLFREAWDRTRHTAYALEVRETVRQMAGTTSPWNRSKSSVIS
jgi:hypothetical protein